MQPARSRDSQEPGVGGTCIREAVQDTSRDVNKISYSGSHGAVSLEELELSLKDIECLGLLVVDVGRRSKLRRDRLLVEEYSPPVSSPNALNSMNIPNNQIDLPPFG